MFDQCTGNGKSTEEYRTTNQKVMPGRVTQSMLNY